MRTKRQKRQSNPQNNNLKNEEVLEDAAAADGELVIAKSSTKEAQTMKTRDCSKLFMPLATWQCAWSGNGNRGAALKLSCIPCAYKIGCFDVAMDKDFVRRVHNQRPEACPRIARTSNNTRSNSNDESLQDLLIQGDGRCLGYRSGMSILTVGDGDFSFSLAVARLLVSLGGEAENDASSKKSRIIATSYESKESLQRVYPTTFDATMKELDQISSNQNNDVVIEIHFEVDATKLSASDFLQPAQSFDRIVWNFPCSAISNGQDGQNKEMEENKSLVAKFVKAAAPLLTARGQIHMNHKTKPPFDQWKIEEVALRHTADDSSAAKGKLVYLGKAIWDRAVFPPHVPRKALDSKSFSTHDACTYIFANGKDDNDSGHNLGTRNGLQVEEIDFVDEEELSKKMALDSANAILVPVTAERIEKLRQRLMHHADIRDKISRAETGAKKKKKRKLAR